MATLSAKESKELGNAAYREKKYEAAVECYTAAIAAAEAAKEEKVHLLYGNRAAAYLALNEYEKVKADCESALAIDPKFVKGYLRLATALEQLGKKEEALKVISKGMALGKEGGKKAKKNAGIPEFKKLAAKIRSETESSDAAERAAFQQALLSNKGSQADLQELQQQIHGSLLQSGKIDREIQRKEMQAQMNNLTKSHLEQIAGKDPNVVTFQSVGRMFLKREWKDVISHLGSEKENLEAELSSLGKAQAHYRREIKNAQNNLKELIPTQQRGTRA